MVAAANKASQAKVKLMPLREVIQIHSMPIPNAQMAPVLSLRCIITLSAVDVTVVFN